MAAPRSIPHMQRTPDLMSQVLMVVVAIVVVVVFAAAASLWLGLGDSEISAAGWVAMVLGVLATLALGIGLMALVFISSRRGFDEPDRDGC